VVCRLLCEDDDNDPSTTVEWAAFGFLYTLAALSFHGARPRGISELDHQSNDAFTVADLSLTALHPPYASHRTPRGPEAIAPYPGRVELK
jgi:hypothetical protein